MEDLTRTKGETQIRYHKLIDEPTVEDPGFFRLELEKDMWNMGGLTLAEEAETKHWTVLQSRLAAACPIGYWKSSVIDVSRLARWAATGLTPIKPVVTSRAT